MKSKLIAGAALAVAGLALSARPALAEETVVVSSTAPEAKAGLNNAFELGLGFGYIQGFGNVGDNAPSLSDTGGAGTNVELDLGWRIDPRFLVGVYGTGAWLSTGNSAGNARNNWTAGAGVQGNYHFRPGGSLDPWVGVGAGWRGYWVNRGNATDSRHGIDFARVQVGLDVPATSGVAISPFVGAATTLFLTQELANQPTFNNVHNPNVGVFFSAGVMGRFDLLGT